MRFSSRFRLEAISLFAVALLAACGGGGGGSSGSTSSGSAPVGNASGNNNAQTPPATQLAGSVTLLPAAATPTALPSASGNATADGIAYINAMRQTVGLPALASDAGLTAASLDHATYLVDNQTYGHDETAGLPGYTGATPQARIAAEGNYSAYGEVVVAGQPAAFPNSVMPVQTLFDAPYHRIVMLDDFQSMGTATSANASWEAFNIDFGNEVNAMPTTAVVTYPYAGQKGVPTSWFANESPNPFANATQYELTTVGYPVTIQSGFAGTLNALNFTITDANGNNVPCLAQTPQTDPGELTNGALCVPYQPLASNATYQVHVTGVLTNGAQNNVIDVAWSFSTGVATVSNEAQPGAPANRPLPLF
ncbi:CAP domain-containing protein [Paraburkholderia ferrariae]|uniref:CAP domain-containing protein n=1 Tax=Paraburkholderia ferrariae TaxID=386056 RepID=UPI0005AB5C76|nr:CAP domain-containing protein [Paraburkholderia ferrariae]